MRGMSVTLLLTVCCLLGSLLPAAAAKSLTVFAASSLTETLQQVEPIFEKAHPGVDVRLNLAASSRCRVQIEQGAPADVFLSADTTNMDLLVKTRLADTPTIFAHNRLLIIAPKSNPGRLNSPADLAKPGLKLVTCGPEVPIGKYTRIVIDKMEASGDYGPSFRARTLTNIVSEEPNVKGIVAKVLLGEADAGICYASDAAAAGRDRLKVIDIPDAVNVIADYPIAVMTTSRSRPLAREFVAFMLAEKGQQALVENGFIPVSPPSATK